jgi:spore maturation protein CgeB
MNTARSLGVQIVFTGQYWPGANTVYIARAFESRGAIVHWLNESILFPKWNQIVSKIIRRSIHRLIEMEWNKQLCDLVDSIDPDLIYISNSHFCWPETLQKIRKKSIPVMCFYHDVRWRNRSRSRFAENIANFDLIATSRNWQVYEFQSAGAKDVMKVRFGYDPDVHRPILINQKIRDRYSADITFIGTSESRRNSDLNDLFRENLHYKFRLWGALWDNASSDQSVLNHWQGREVFEQEIPIIYAASKIALHWVGWDPDSPDNEMRRGDQHNSRTFQIAACGGAMMIAQRTEEHLKLFEQGVEVDYFSDADELRDKITYWLNPENDQQRREMSTAARERCLREDYSYKPVVAQYLDYFGLNTV